MIWNSQTDGIAFGMLQPARYFASGLEYKCVTSGRDCLERSVLSIVEFGVTRDFRKVPAHQGKMMVLIHLTDGADTRHHAFIAQLSTQCIAGVSRIRDHAARLDNTRSLPYQPQLRIIGMYGKKLSHFRGRRMRDVL